MCIYVCCVYFWSVFIFQLLVVGAFFKFQNKNNSTFQLFAIEDAPRLCYSNGNHGFILRFLASAMQPLNHISTNQTEQEENVYGRLEFQSDSNSCQLFLGQVVREKNQPLCTYPPTFFFLSRQYWIYYKVFSILYTWFPN